MNTSVAEPESEFFTVDAALPGRRGRCGVIRTPHGEIRTPAFIGVGTQATFGSSQSNLVQAIRQSTSESTNQAGQRIVEKNLNVQPTITIRPGWPLRVIVHKDLVLQPYRG